MPERRVEVMEALLAKDCARTYRETAAALGVSIGTLYEHLRRMRKHEPEFYALLMKKRAQQIAVRKEFSLARARAHTWRWFARRRYGS